MDRTIDTSRTVVVVGSTLGTVWKLVWSAVGLLVASGLLALVIMLLLAAGGSPVDAAPSFAHAVLTPVGYLLAFFFAVLIILSISTIIECWKFLKISDNILTITPNGIRDRRVTEEFVPWRAVKSARTAAHRPDYYSVHSAPGTAIPVRRSVLDVVLDIDPALISQALKDQARMYGTLRARGKRPPLEDTRPWITFTIDLWRLKNTDATALYDLCAAYARAAQAKRAA